MWKLMMTNAAKEWIEAGRFETMIAASQRICAMEGEPNQSGFFLSFYVEPYHQTDDEAFGHLEFKGKQVAYVIKRVRMN